MKSLVRFRGGVKLPGFKSLSTKSPIQKTPLPKKLILPLSQHIGDSAKPVVRVGDYVYKGQIIADSSSFVSAPIHASSSGKIIEIGPYMIPHQSGIAETCIVIETDGNDQWHPDIKQCDTPSNLSADQIRKKIKQAGIVGLGGAVFPSSAKLKPTREIDTLIINGVECEPYITCDDALMRSRADEIVHGILLLRRVLNPIECVIAIENNKPEAIKAVQSTLARFKQENIGSVNTIRVVPVPTIFPAGGEKQLIKQICNKEVPQHSLPYEVGVVCLNVGTTAAIYDCIYRGRPLISRLVTITGEAVNRPANYQVLIGTQVEHVLAAAGGVQASKVDFIMGGPMMGQVLPDTGVPVVKATNCLLVKTPEKSKKQPVQLPCIRCGACANACPMQLLPQQLYWHARGKHFEKLNHYNLTDCIECGCCSVVCPSKIPLVHYFRFAKTEMREHEVKSKFADQSRLRMLARDARLERIKKEQEERKARRKAEREKKKAANQKQKQISESPKASSG